MMSSELRNIQKQVWVVTFDADKIPYNRLDERLKMLDGILKAESIPMGERIKSVLYSLESLEYSIKKAQNEAKSFVEPFEPMKTEDIKKDFPR